MYMYIYIHVYIIYMYRYNIYIYTYKYIYRFLWQALYGHSKFAMSRAVWKHKIEQAQILKSQYIGQIIYKAKNLSFLYRS